LQKASRLGIEIKPVEPVQAKAKNQTYVRFGFDQVNQSILDSRNKIEASKLTIRDAVEAIKSKEKEPKPVQQPVQQPTHTFDAFKYGLVVATIVVFTFVGGMAKAGLLI